MTIPIGSWYRTCQECGHEQLAKEPDRNKPLSDSYRNSKCRRCKSEALDYGTTRTDPNDWGPETDDEDARLRNDLAHGREE